MVRLILCRGEWLMQLTRRSTLAHVSTQLDDLFLGMLQLQPEVLLKVVGQLANGEPHSAEASRPVSEPLDAAEQPCSCNAAAALLHRPCLPRQPPLCTSLLQGSKASSVAASLQPFVMSLWRACTAHHWSQSCAGSYTVQLSWR